MLAQVMEPQGPGFPDEQAQDAVPCGQVTYRMDAFFINSDRDEVAQVAVFSDHPQGTIPRPDQGARGSDKTVQHGFEGEILGEGHHSGQQRVHPDLAVRQ
jgi:hypothetical protein